MKRLVAKEPGGTERLAVVEVPMPHRSVRTIVADQKLHTLPGKTTVCEAARLMNQNRLSLATEISLHSINKIKEQMEHSKTKLDVTATYMDDLIHTEKQWEERYPQLINKYGRPVIEKAYDVLAFAAN